MRQLFVDSIRKEYEFFCEKLSDKVIFMTHDIICDNDYMFDRNIVVDIISNIILYGDQNV